MIQLVIILSMIYLILNKNNLSSMDNVLLTRLFKKKPRERYEAIEFFLSLSFEPNDMIMIVLDCVKVDFLFFYSSDPKVFFSGLI